MNRDSVSISHQLVVLIAWAMVATVAFAICALGIASAHRVATTGASLDQISGLYALGPKGDGIANPTQLSIGLSSGGKSKFVFGNNVGDVNSKPMLNGTVKRTSSPNVYRLYATSGKTIGYLFYQPGVTTWATKTITIVTSDGETLLSRQSNEPLGNV